MCGIEESSSISRKDRAIPALIGNLESTDPNFVALGSGRLESHDYLEEKESTRGALGDEESNDSEHYLQPSLMEELAYVWTTGH
jgi:hypothetical protein